MPICILCVSYRYDLKYCVDITIRSKLFALKDLYQEVTLGLQKQVRFSLSVIGEIEAVVTHFVTK